MSAAGGLMQAGASGLAALGSLAQGSVKAAAARAEAAGYRASADSQARRIRSAATREVSRSRADVVGAGVSLSSGSALEAEREIVRASEQDAMLTILNGENQARVAEEAGRAEQLNSIIGALGSAGDAVDKWRRARPSAGDGLSQGDRRKIGVY